jgi:uncharacterized membrane protein YedE/YeeE
MLFKWPLFQYQFLLLCLLILLRDIVSQTFWAETKFVDNMLLGVLFFWATFALLKRFWLVYRLLICFALAFVYAFVFQSNHFLMHYIPNSLSGIALYLTNSLTVFLGSLVAYLLLLWNLKKVLLH